MEKRRRFFWWRKNRTGSQSRDMDEKPESRNITESQSSDMDEKPGSRNRTGSQSRDMDDKLGRRTEGRILPDHQLTTTMSLAWRIDRLYSLLPAGGSYLFYGPSFSFLDAEWWPLINPTTTREPGSPLYLSLGLKLSPTSSSWNVLFRLGIRARDGTELQTHIEIKEFAPDSLVLHKSILLSKEDIDFYVPDGNLTVFCCLWGISERREVASETREAACQTELEQGGLLRDLKSLFLNGTGADLTLKVGGRPFEVHKAVLVARSPVFAAMLQHDISERRSSTLEIEDCDPQAFRDFLVYLYSDTAEDLSKSNVLHLYKTANKYDVEDLKAKCVLFMRSSLSLDMFCDVATLALTHNESELLQEVTDFLTKNLEAITASAAWQTLLEDYPVAGRKIHTKALQQKAGQENSLSSANSSIQSERLLTIADFI